MEALINEYLGAFFGWNQDYGINEEELEEMVILITSYKL